MDSPTPPEPREEELSEELSDFFETADKKDLEQAARDLVMDAEYRDGFRFYSVSPEKMRRLAELVDLDHLFEH
jgi:hypothetical protein